MYVFIFEAEHRYPEIFFPLYFRGQNISPKVWMHLQTVLKTTGFPFHVVVLTFFPRAQSTRPQYILPAFSSICSALPVPSLLWPFLCSSSSTCMTVMCVTGCLSLSEHHFAHCRLAVLYPTVYPSEDSYSFPQT